MSEITLFGETTYRNEMRRFGIKTDDRRRHMYLIGKTGMGKSTILENMMINDINSGHGLAITDPHGDLAEKIIKYIPKHRIKDVIYFNPGDINFPIAFNVIEQVDPHFRHLVASGLLGVFKKLWADSWGPRLEYTLRNSILAVLDYPDATLLAVVRMLSDKVFRKEVVSHIKDPVVKAFWTKEFASYTDKFASEAVAPIQNKVGQFLSASLIRNIVGQTSSSLNIREIMDQRKILIMNLSKGLIGEDNMQLLGAMMITKIQLAAMSRVNIPEHERNDFYLYVDEFQNFATESFANILSEARKYRLNLIMAHQYIEQLDEKVRDAVFGNVGSFVVCRVGASDAEVLAPEFAPTFEEEDIVNIPKYEFYCKLMIDGISSDPFSAKGIAPKSASEETGNVEEILAFSRETYSQDRHVVEEKISAWHETTDEPPRERAERAGKLVYPEKRTFQDNRTQNFSNRPNEGTNANQGGGRAYSDRPNEGANQSSGRTYGNKFNNGANANQNSRRTYDDRPNDGANTTPRSGNNYPCAKCGISTYLSFVPDGVRPVYCKECLIASKDARKNIDEERQQQKQIELRRLQEEAERNRSESNETFRLNLSKPKPASVNRVSVSDSPAQDNSRKPELTARPQEQAPSAASQTPPARTDGQVPSAASPSTTTIPNAAVNPQEQAPVSAAPSIASKSGPVTGVDGLPLSTALHSNPVKFRGSPNTEKKPELPRSDNREGELLDSGEIKIN